MWEWVSHMASITRTNLGRAQNPAGALARLARFDAFLAANPDPHGVPGGAPGWGPGGGRDFLAYSLKLYQSCTPLCYGGQNSDRANVRAF